MRKAALILLLVLAAAAHAQDGVPLFTTDFPPEEFKARREKVYAAIGENGIAIVQGAPSPTGYTRFRQSNEFYYLTGIEVPHAYVILDGRRKVTMLYLPHRNQSRERSEGKLLSAEDADLVKKLSGVDVVAPLDRLGEHLARHSRAASLTVWTPFLPAEGTSMSRDLGLRAVGDSTSDPFDGRPSREGQFIELLRVRYPLFDVKNLTPALDAMRLIKSPRELVIIRKSTRASALALVEAMRSTEPGISEYELDAVAKFIYYRNGAQGDAYYSLIASGPNAIYPHYNTGKRVMKDGDFLLMDYAPDVGYYMSDVTRMWPVNGKFNAWQRELYTFYLDCYRAILKRIRPNVTAKNVIAEAATDMDAVFARTKFSKPIYEAAAKKFIAEYRDGWPVLGHWVGMATHDVGEEMDMLRPGMVFTIEPQFVVPEEQIYIRLEDMIFIGDEKAENVTDWLPMDIDGIEKIMKEPGMLQKYPRMPAEK
jgi:Xaa-Pro aminopeptidase